MKKFLLLLALGCWLFAANAQTRPSLTKTADKVVLLEAKNNDLETKIEQIQGAYRELSFTLDSLQANNAKLKIPTSVEEANATLVYIVSFIQFIFVGFLGDKLPKWLSPFVLSVVVGLGVAVVAYFFSGGAFTLNEAVTFFLAISGGSNIIHQIKKPKTTPA